MALRLQAGLRVAHFELEELLGRGGFGEVWRVGSGPERRFKAAAKFIATGGKASAVERRALELLCDIRHPHLVEYQHAEELDGYFMVVMTLCDGDLSKLLDRHLDDGQPGVPPELVIRHLKAAAEGLDYLNAPNWPSPEGGLGSIVHRDVKPANLLLAGGMVRVGDFGLAKLIEKTAATATGGLTAAYAAPEMFAGQVTARSDQYCLAATYFQLRTGDTLFAGPANVQMYNHLESPPDLSAFGRAESAALARALAKKPEDRFASCVAFIEAARRGLAHDTRKATRTPAADTEAEPVSNEPPAPPPPADMATGSGWVPSSATMPEPKSPPVPPVTAPNPKMDKTLFVVVVGLAAVLLVVVPILIAEPSAKQPSPVPPTENLPKQRPVNAEPPPKQTTVPPPAAIAPPVAGEREEAFTYLIDGEQRSGKRIVLTFDLGGGVTLDMVKLPGGSFVMGAFKGEANAEDDEMPPHTATVSWPLYVGKYEVTQAQWRAIMGDNPSWFSAVGGGMDMVAKMDADGFPVEQVSWDDCQDFCRRLAAKTGKPFRLPTEAEWEYACRAGTTTPFHFGGRLNGDHANVNGKYHYPAVAVAVAEGPYLERTAKVGFYTANAFGLHDMHGNVWEWCQDAYDSKFYAKSKAAERDPLAAESDQSSMVRVLRGGSWYSHAWYSRAANRSRDYPVDRLRSYGCRVAFRLD